MRKPLTKALALVLACCVCASSTATVLAGDAMRTGPVQPIVQTQPADAQNTDPNVIDYSFAQLPGWGYSFALSGNEYRWQTFTATKDGPIEAVEVALYKKNPVTAAFIDLHAELYMVQDGMPVGEPLAVGPTLTGDQVNSATPDAEVTQEMVTRLELSYSLKAGQQYAVVLKSSKTTGDGGDTTGGGQCYDWFCGPAVAGEYFGKTEGIEPTVNWKDESGLGTAWMKVYYQNAPSSIDYTFDSDANGFGFGATGNEWRWQSFTSVQAAEMESVDIKVTKFDHSAESGLEKTGDLIVAVYATDAAGLPTGQPLAQTTVPADSITSKQPVNVPLSCPLENGVRYAVAMTMATPLSLHGGYDCYGWATGSVPAADATSEQFGKTNNGNDVNNITENNWVTEDLGTGYLKVNYAGAQPAEPQPTTIRLSADKTVLNAGETAVLTATVLDQYGEEMEGQNVQFVSEDPARATVEGNVVTAVSDGMVKITASCGAASASISLSIRDADGRVVPVPGMVITEDTTFKPGEYDFGGASQGIVIAGSNITVDGTGVVIHNADPATLREDVTSGAYAYQLNPADGETVYQLTRSWDMTDADKITLSYDVKADAFAGAMKVYVSENGKDFKQVSSKTDVTGEWTTVETDLSAYAGKTVQLRIAYEADGEVPAGLGLRLDSIELYEDGVRTFSDLAEAKVYYWWDAAYGDGQRVDNAMKNKPFDRTAYTIPTARYQGVGICADGVENVTIKGFGVHGFHDAVYITNSTGVTIENNDLSNNFTDPNGGWGDQLGGAVTLENVSDSTIRGNVANNNANGLYMKYSSGNTVVDNDFSVCSDVCLEMWNSSHNDIRNNNFSWGIRIDPYDEVHARDSTSQLMEAGSNYNYFYNNDFTHGGDGIFIRVGNGWSCEGNVFEKNDTSFANNNAVESWAGRNYFINNKANYSSYGFWLGGTDESVVKNNEIAYNGIMPANAAERGAGNGGLVYLNGTAEHLELVGNYIHDNNGSGIAIRYDVSKRTDGYVAGHILIQNNIIENTTKGAGEGAAIYLDSTDWVDISGNRMEGNVVDGVFANESGKYPVTNVFEHDGEYIADPETYENTVPTAKITTDKTQYKAGEEITFSAADSISRGGELTYRWSMGDDFGSKATVRTGETVKFTFEEPGYYDVALTVTDGEWSDIAWLNVNVTAGGEEIGTDEAADAWQFSDGLSAAADDRGGVQEAIIPEVKQWADFKTYYSIDGDHSIAVSSRTAENTLIYPATRDLGADFSKDHALSFSARIHDELNWYSANSPTVILYTDENNYFTYQANDTFLSPLNFADIKAGQWRTEWVPMYIPYTGDANWTMTRTGNPDLSNINYIQITAQTSGDGTYLWVDGLKSVYTGEVTPVYGPNLSVTGQSIADKGAAESDPEAPLGKEISASKAWVSQPGKSASYGVEYPEQRYVNRIELSLLANPLGDTPVALPQDYTVQYRENGSWKEVSGLQRAVKITSGKNIIAFDAVNTDAVRVVFDNAPDSAVAVYGFATLNADNQAALTTFEGKNLTVVSSTILTDSVLESVEMVININDTAAWPDGYQDFTVYLSEVSEDGTQPVGPALATGTLTKEEITEGGFGKAYDIPLRTADGEKFVLKAGKRYAVNATQVPVNPDPDGTAGPHYRWATSSGVAAGKGEYFGKMDSTDPANLTGHTEDLGTGWMKVHTDQDKDGKAAVDFSWEPLPTAGFGLGHNGEPGRYQTFTTTSDTVYNLVDGLLDDGQPWVVPEGTQAASFDVEGTKTLSAANIWLGETLPAGVAVYADDVKVAETTDLHKGFNLLAFDAVDADVIRVEFAGKADVYEVELFERKEQPPQPTAEPTAEPTAQPTAQPTAEPTAQPTQAPQPSPDTTAAPGTDPAPGLPATGDPAGLTVLAVLLAACTGGAVWLYRKARRNR